MVSKGIYQEWNFYIFRHVLFRIHTFLFHPSSGWINLHPCPWVWNFSQFIISSPLGIIRCHFPPKLMDMKRYSIFICLYFLSGLLMLSSWLHIFMTIHVSLFTLAMGKLRVNHIGLSWRPPPWANVTLKLSLLLILYPLKFSFYSFVYFVLL